MSDEFSWNRSTISLAASIGFLVNGLSQPILGRIYDRVGARRVVLVSLTALGAATMLLALTNHIIVLILIFGVVLSLAMSGGSLNILAVVLTKWFRRRRGTVVAICAAGASVGGLLLVPFTSYLIEVVGWRAAWAVLGLLVLALAVPLAFFFLREDPAEMGLLPDGDAGPPAGPRGSRPAVRGPLEAEYWYDPFRSRPMWQISGAYFVCGFTTAIISAHFVAHAIEEGFAPSAAATAFGLMSGLNAVGVLAAGALGDRFGRKNFLSMVYALRGCGYMALLLVPGPFGLWAFVGLAGFSWLATVPLTTSLTADVYGLKNLGLLTGISYAVHNVGGALGIQLGRDHARPHGGLRRALCRGRRAPRCGQSHRFLHSGEEVLDKDSGGGRRRGRFRRLVGHASPGGAAAPRRGGRPRPAGVDQAPVGRGDRAGPGAHRRAAGGADRRHSGSHRAAVRGAAPEQLRPLTSPPPPVPSPRCPQQRVWSRLRSHTSRGRRPPCPKSARHPERHKSVFTALLHPL